VSKLWVPRPYQRNLRLFAHDHDRCNWWAGMGMGKTSAMLMTLQDFQLVEPGPALILAPLRVANSTWPDEAAKWTQLHDTIVQPITGDLAARTKALRQDASVFTINYEQLPWLIDQFDGKGRPWPFRCVVADEATRLKGFRSRQGTKRAKALARVAHTRVSRWINMTGTPAPNGLIDTWGQNWFVDAGQRLGWTYTAFVERWFNRVANDDGYPIIKPSPFAQEQIGAKLADVTITEKAKDYFDLKEPIVRKVMVRLPPKVRALYTEMEKRMFMEIGGYQVEAVNAASRTTKCLQICSGAVIVDSEEKKWEEVHDQKLQALESIVAECNGAPLLVSYYWKSDLVRLKRAFPKARELDKNPKTIHDWNAGKIPMLLAHPQSAGHGLNLQDGGNIVVFFSDWWNLEYHDQIIERIGPVRQMQAGHDREVWFYFILCENTVDEDVLLRHTSKRSVQDILMDAAKKRGRQ
jgi:SNF2 family DNA or RNA helicase